MDNTIWYCVTIDENDIVSIKTNEQYDENTMQEYKHGSVGSVSGTIIGNNICVLYYGQNGTVAKHIFAKTLSEVTNG